MRHLLRNVIFCLLLVFFFWLAGLQWFTSQILNSVGSASGFDAVVVLTGGSGRIEQGLRLLAAQPDKKLLISGAGKKATVQNMINKSPKELHDVVAEHSENIILGHEAENTIGNAEEIAVWLDGQENVKSLAVVTSCYHMPRALEELRQRVPAVALSAYAVYSDDFTADAPWVDASSRALLFSEYHKFIAAKLRHYFLSVTS